MQASEKILAVEGDVRVLAEAMLNSQKEMSRHAKQTAEDMKKLSSSQERLFEKFADIAGGMAVTHQQIADTNDRIVRSEAKNTEICGILSIQAGKTEELNVDVLKLSAKLESKIHLDVIERQMCRDEITTGFTATNLASINQGKELKAEIKILKDYKDTQISTFRQRFGNIIQIFFTTSAIAGVIALFATKGPP